MKEVNVKFLFLLDCCVGARLRIRSAGKVLARLPDGLTYTLYIPEELENLTFTYSFPIRTTIQLPKDEDKVFIVVYYSVREYFPAVILDMFRKLLVAKVVTEEEFNRASKEEYKKAINPRQDFEQDVSVLVIGFLLSFVYIFLPFVLLKNQVNNRDLSFFIGVMGIIGFAMLIQQKKMILLKEYKARVLVFSALSIMLDFILPLSAFMRFTLLLATGMLITKVLMMRAKIKK